MPSSSHAPLDHFRHAAAPLSSGGHPPQDGFMSTHQPVVRVWRGVIRTQERDEYVEYVERTGMRQYRATPGNLDAWILTRDLGDGASEILTVSRWESMNAVRAFAGADVDRAVYYPEDDDFLVERDEIVRHYTQET
jgi:heme-degrading monooxygenase HmoA